MNKKMYGYSKFISRNFLEVRRALDETLKTHSNNIIEASSRIKECYEKRCKLIILGNGGSYADACHFAAELEGAYKNRDRPGLSALVPGNPAALTAIANDYGYESVFSRFVKANAGLGDVVIGISTSGNSTNIVEALKDADNRMIYTIGMSGEGGGNMKEYCDILLDVPSKDTPTIQTVHNVIYHSICEIVENELFPRKK